MSRANTNSRAAYNRTYQASRYQRLKASGLCVWCGSRPATLNRKGHPGCRCKECARKANAVSKEKMRRLRPAWKALGICIVCGCRRAIQGQAWCGVCSERQETHHEAKKQVAA